MKRIIHILLIFYSTFAFAEAPLKELWDKISYERGIEGERGFLCRDVKAFFEKAGEKELIFFYPKGCGFDHLTSGEFLELEEFFELAEAYGYEITYCSSQRYLVSFEDRDEMEEFVRDTFGTELKEGDVPLYFPSKIIIAELIELIKNEW